MLILDTSTIIEILKDTEKGNRISEFIQGQEAAITSFSVHELMIGAKEREITRLEMFFASVKIFSFDLMAALESWRLEKNLIKGGKTIEESDIFIAGICLAANAKLITLDKGFEGVKSLDVKFF